MQNVPKIVRQRLQAATPALDHPFANHPDANVLTAFAERLLAAGDRAIVLEHLARCGDCRDIVALALPASEPVQTTVTLSRREWLTWPALRWAFVAAGVVAIAALGVVQYQRGGRSQSMASKASARLEIAAKEAKNQPLAPPASPTDKKPDAQGEARTTSVGSQLNSGRSPRAVIGGTLPHGPRRTNQWQQKKSVQNQAIAASSPFAKQHAAGDLSANLRVPAASQTVGLGHLSAQSDTQAQDLNAVQIEAPLSKNKSAAPPQPDEDYALTRVGKAKPAGTTSTAIGGILASSGATPAPSQVRGAETLALSAPIPIWSIDSTGALQRSFDQGATWQAVDVNANPASFTDATTMQIAGKTSRAKARKISSPTFRAVSATGVDVWAGGAGGALYHSTDAGDHWTRVMPASSGATLSGDIVRLEFADVQHGKVSTSTAEVWTTSDAGLSWQKQ